MTLHVSGERLLTADGAPVRLRGVGLGGWLNMENFITGYPANESAMREAVTGVLGEERAELFFDRLLTAFFGPGDAALLAELGMNCVRIPVNYHHLESDSRPFEIIEHGFRHLDRVIDLLGEHGVYSVIDLHALPGSQNQHWHSDNPTHLAAFWQHRHFQDRVVNLWETIADRYKDHPWVAGYNPVNEPGDPSGKVIGPFYDRLVKAVRAADPGHVLFLDGNTYSTDFSVFREVYENTVFVCHDYALAGFAHGGPYPGMTRGEWCDREQLERAFDRRTTFQRQTGTPLWVGEFGPVYTGDPVVDEQRYQILRDQLEIYDAHGAGWSLWTYKDVGLQGLVCASGPYGERFGAFMDKKRRLGADRWGSTMEESADELAPLHRLVERSSPDGVPIRGAPATPPTT
ncbi:glycoside hydrolase family 5 protein [Nonomuraea recticatena]|uniref:glycoside hydrolase family 5 protein n=1 Tax=Nonomuraea recticatena TaxID=46178 RepID=UPI003611904F